MAQKTKEKKEPPKGSREACARQILDVVPRAMRLLRREMRKEAGQGLSVPQLRVLAFLSGSPGASLSAVSDFAGVADATASAMVDRLVRRELVTRETDPEERRRVCLGLTAEGAALLGRARARARTRVAQNLAVLSGSELASLGDGLNLLRRVLEAAAEAQERP